MPSQYQRLGTHGWSLFESSGQGGKREKKNCVIGETTVQNLSKQKLCWGEGDMGSHFANFTSKYLHSLSNLMRLEGSYVGVHQYKSTNVAVRPCGQPEC